MTGKDIVVPEDGTYNFTIQIDDNGYLEINGEKVAELTGSHSSTSVSGSKELKKGFHYAKLHHENLAVPEEIAPYPNAEEFVPKMGNSEWNFGKLMLQKIFGILPMHNVYWDAIM